MSQSKKSEKETTTMRKSNEIEFSMVHLWSDLGGRKQQWG